MKDAQIRFSTIALISLLFSLAVNLPSIWAAKYAPLKQFTDLDEPYYLSRALSLGAGHTTDFFYHEEQFKRINPYQHILHDLRGIPELLVGRLGNLLGLSSPSLGLVLDLTIAPLSFIAWGLLLGNLIGNFRIGLIISGITMILPWVISPGFFFKVPFISLENIGVYSGHFEHDNIGRFPEVPFLRSISTQLSYPIVGLALWLISQSSKSPLRAKRTLVIAGSLTGVLIYIYVFAFGSVLLLGSWMLFYPGLIGRIRSTLTQLTVFWTSCAIVMLPSFATLYLEKNISALKFHEVGDFYFLPPILLLQAGAAIILMRLYRKNSNIHNLLWLYAGISILEIPLVNLQPITKVAMAPYHFGELYLHPLGSAVLLLLLWATNENALVRRRIVSALLLGLVLISALVPISRVIYSMPEDAISYTELYNYVLSDIPTDSVIAFPPLPRAFQDYIPDYFTPSPLPVAMASLTERYLLYQMWAPSFDLDSLKRELLLGWLYTGSLVYAWGCPSTIDLPGDLFKLTWTTIKLMRRSSCARMTSLRENISPCELLRSYKVTHIFWDRKSQIPEPVHGTPIWKDTRDQLRVYSTDQPALIAANCAVIKN